MVPSEGTFNVADQDLGVDNTEATLIQNTDETDEDEGAVSQAISLAMTLRERWEADLHSMEQVAPSIGDIRYSPEWHHMLLASRLRRVHGELIVGRWGENTENIEVDGEALEICNHCARSPTTDTIGLCRVYRADLRAAVSRRIGPSVQDVGCGARNVVFWSSVVSKWLQGPKRVLQGSKSLEVVDMHRVVVRVLGGVPDLHQRRRWQHRSVPSANSMRRICAVRRRKKRV